MAEEFKATKALGSLVPIKHRGGGGGGEVEPSVKFDTDIPEGRNLEG